MRSERMKIATLLMISAMSLSTVFAATPVIIAHRGASGDAPENTLAAFKEAWNQNADGVELDIYLTKDGRIVVLHDASTRRTAGKDLTVKDHSLEELRALYEQAQALASLLLEWNREFGALAEEASPDEFHI